MALSRKQIINLALAELPADRIDSEEDLSFEAETAREHYQPALELLLEDHDWDFAIRRVTLAAVTNDRGNEWTYAYDLPTDLASPRRLLPFGADEMATSIPGYSPVGRLRGFEAITPYVISGGTLFTDREAAVLEYVTNEPEEATFTAKFARALVTELASRLVMPIKKDSRRKGELMRQAEIDRERAKADDMNRDRETIRDFVPDMQLARLGLLG
jgi:hypothetical protein